MRRCNSTDLYSHTVIDKLTDVSNEIIIGALAESLRVAWRMIVPLTRRIVGFGVDMFTDTSIFVVLAAMKALDVLAGTVIGVVAGVAVEVLAGVDFNI